LRNDGGNKSNWLIIQARLPGGKSDAIGARVIVTSGSLRQLRDLIPVTGYLSQADPRCHFGLGRASEAVTVEIRWPDKQTTKREGVKTNQILTVIQGS
jgi:hypothetical protein